MRTRGTRVTFAALATGIALVAAGCGSAGKPIEPAPVGAVGRPLPANAEVPAKSAGGGGSADASCDTRSTSPTGTSVTSGSTMAKIKSRGQLIAGVDQTTYLFGFRNPTTGELEGFDIDMVKQIAKAIFGTDQGTIRYRAIPSSQRIPVLKNHEVDVVVRTMSITCDRLKDINFSSKYYVAGQRVLVNKNSPAKKLGDLGGKKVCATKSSTSLPRIAAEPAKPVPVAVDNWSDCLVMLQQGQVDAVSTDDVILAGMAAQDPTLQVVGDRFSTENYGIGIPKDQTDMVGFVNSVLDTVRAGPWRDSYNNWLTGKLPPADPPAGEYK